MILSLNSLTYYTDMELNQSSTEQEEGYLSAQNLFDVTTVESPFLVNINLDKYSSERNLSTPEVLVNTTKEVSGSSYENNNSTVKTNYNIADDVKWLKFQVNHLQSSNQSLQNRVKELETYTDDLFDQIEKNQIDIVNLQAYSRRENIEISGIPESIKDSELENLVIDILSSIDVIVSKSKISACHRLMKETNSTHRNVIVRFVNRKDAQNALRNSHKLKNSDYRKRFGNSIYIRENLCPYFKRIFNRCYALWCNDSIYDMHSKNGKVLIKLIHEDKWTAIYSMEQINQEFDKKNWHKKPVM